MEVFFCRKLQFTLAYGADSDSLKSAHSSFSEFQLRSLAKKLEKLRPHPPQQNAEVNEYSQIWPPLQAVKGGQRPTFN